MINGRTVVMMTGSNVTAVHGRRQECPPGPLNGMTGAGYQNETETDQGGLWNQSGSPSSH